MSTNNDFNNIISGKNEICMIAKLIIQRRGEGTINSILNEYIHEPQFIERTLKHTIWAITKCHTNIRLIDLLNNISYATAIYCSCLIISAEEILTENYYEHE